MEEMAACDERWDVIPPRALWRHPGSMAVHVPRDCLRTLLE